MPKLTRHRPTAIVYLQDCSWARESRADFMHLTPKDEEPLFTADGLDSYEIGSRPAASPRIGR